MIKYFETIRCDKGKVYYLQYHKKRIFNTIGKELNFILTPPDNNLYRCKVIYTKDKICDISYYPYSLKEIKRFKIIFDDNIQYSSKYLDRSCIDRYKSDIYDEIIFVKNGYITDTSIANIAIFLDNEWITPIKPLLYGTTRQRYIDTFILTEANITIDMMKRSDKIMLLNAMSVREFKQNSYTIIE